MHRLFVVAQLFGQVSSERIQNVCTGPGADVPNPICSAVFQATENRALAQLAGNLIPALLKIILIVVIAYVANRVLKRAIKRFTRRLATGGVERLGKMKQRAPLADTSPMDISRAAMRTETIGAVLNSISTFVVWLIATFLVMGAFGIQLGPLIAGAGVAGVALGFGAQRMVQDFLAGTFIILEDQYGIGDIVDLRDSIGSVGAGGTVEALSLRTTRIRDVEGTVWYVPNGEIRTAGNKSQQWARSLLDIGVAYNTNVDHASRVLKQVADEVWGDPEFGPSIIEEPEVWGLERFDADQITLRMVLKVKPAKQWAVNRELRGRIKQAFDREGIEIPFPQRTVWVRSANGAPDDSTLEAAAGAGADEERAKGS
ncbi:MAG: mechanosensitive ion channel family protein [Egibacteraceae bacterium]